MAARRAARIAALLLAVAVVGWVVLIGAVYAWGGLVTVRVQDPAEGLDFFLPVPAVLLEAAVSCGGAVTPVDGWAVPGVPAAEWRPLAAEVVGLLDELPDVTLVEVVERGERVRVRKRGGALEVDVEGDVSVRLSVPTRAVRRAVARLAPTA